MNDTFRTGEISFTLDADYPAGTVLALAKTGSGYTSYGTASIIGPDCSADLTHVAFGNREALGGIALPKVGDWKGFPGATPQPFESCRGDICQPSL